MIKPQRLFWLAPLALLGAAVASSSGSSARPATTAPAAPATALRPFNPETDARAPLSFSLQSRPGGPELLRVVSVEIEPRGALPYPVTMAVSLPAGASLVEGEREQVIEIRSAAKITRELRVALARPLDLADPIKVTLRGHDEVSGLSGEKQLPPRPEMAAPRLGAPPPGGRPHR